MTLRLGDIGERRIIREYLRSRYGAVPGFGDDAATVVTTRGYTVVATTDPCPPPAAELLGESDPYFAGWLLATINLSDLAAAGATPVGLLTSLVLQRDMTIVDLERLLDGVDECCAVAGCHVIGGNLKEGLARDLGATAIGICEGRAPLGRVGGQPGDDIVVLGDLGLFWAGALAVRRGIIDISSGSPILRNVLTPSPKVDPMRRAAEEGLIRAAIDNSDGLYPTLLQLADAAGCGAHLDAGAFCFAPNVVETAEVLAIEPIRLALGWGDWQVIAVASPSNTDSLLRLVKEAGVNACVVGRLEEGSGVWLRGDWGVGQLMPLDSERFSPDSWFTSGLEAYISQLTTARLVAPAE